jgi:glutaredoxin
MLLLSIYKERGSKMGHLLKILLTTILFIISSQGFAAVDIVECEDVEGNRSFQKVCPPGSSQIGKKKIATGTGAKEESKGANIEAILYSIPDCEACDEIREFLGNRNISITEKDVNDNIELQTELTELTGALKVPTTVIGEEVLTGYSRSKFLNVLKAAGYEEDS